MKEVRLREEGRRVSLVVLAVALVMPGCSIRRMAINALGNALAEGTSVYARDDDPELIRDAVPFALKTVEGLLEQSPRHRGLLLSAASGFTQYSYAFLQCEADYLEDQDLPRATEMRRRARKLYGRAMEYGLRGLEVSHPGFRAALRGDAQRALAVMRRTDAPFLYWTAAAWGSAISLAKEDAELTADLSLTEALMRRALDLDEGFGGGAVHDFFIAYEGGRPASAGGSVQVAREHLTRALELSRQHRAAPLVSYAETVLVGIQDRAEFERMLADALAVDPDKDLDQRMANLVAQKRARWLLSLAGSFFIE